MKQKTTKTYEIYKKDKWNMLHVEVLGRQLVVREISDQWGEESYSFQSRPEMMNWAVQRFAFTPNDSEVAAAEKQAILDAFKEV